MDSECTNTIKIIKTKLIVNDYIFIFMFQKKVSDDLRYTCVQRKEHCKGT